MLSKMNMSKENNPQLLSTTYFGDNVNRLRQDAMRLNRYFQACMLERYFKILDEKKRSLCDEYSRKVQEYDFAEERGFNSHIFQELAEEMHKIHCEDERAKRTFLKNCESFDKGTPLLDLELIDPHLPLSNLEAFIAKHNRDLNKTFNSIWSDLSQDSACLSDDNFQKGVPEADTKYRDYASSRSYSCEVSPSSTNNSANSSFNNHIWSSSAAQDLKKCDSAIKEVICASKSLNSSCKEKPLEVFDFEGFQGTPLSDGYKPTGQLREDSFPDFCFSTDDENKTDESVEYVIAPSLPCRSNLYDKHPTMTDKNSTFPSVGKTDPSSALYASRDSPITSAVQTGMKKSARKKKPKRKKKTGQQSSCASGTNAEIKDTGLTFFWKSTDECGPTALNHSETSALCMKPEAEEKIQVLFVDTDMQNKPADLTPQSLTEQGKGKEKHPKHVKPQFSYASAAKQALAKETNPWNGTTAKQATAKETYLSNGTASTSTGSGKSISGMIGEKDSCPVRKQIATKLRK